MPQTGAGEIRQDPLTHRWVIYAPGRAERPNEMEPARRKADRLPEKDAQCPFCSGHEAMTPPVILELPGDGPERWRTRVVPNKYPVLRPDAQVAGTSRGSYRVTTNYGRHEVVIETPFHDRDLPFMTAAEAEAVIETYVQRHQAIRRLDEAVKTILIFRNHGRRAGTSLRHPHSQIVATALVPESVALRERIAADYYRQNQRCVLCDIIAWEQSERTRLLYENDSFLSFVPFAAAAPCEIWIAPRRHAADFGSIPSQEQGPLAAALQDALRRLHETLNDPDYNYVIHSGFRPELKAPHRHWYLEIRPRLTTPAGFEIGSGMEINPSWPERDAEALRRQNRDSTSETA
jgi:UDPglucose--hexose-1-phosphate uridylyltransferase